ncbi:MAG: DnaD domain protein [Bacilli bacterium]|nr:DnaD domain protein [Bacilli bacterium]
MIVLNGKDFMEVKLASLVADYDREILVNLYQPIIGFTGLAVYFSLWAEANNQKVVSIINHEQFFNRMKINTTQFVDARKLLEGIGLVKTYVQNSSEVKIYHYDVFAPRTPKDFFDNALLYGMFIKSVGELEANKAKNIFHMDRSLEKGQDISSTFVDAYRPDFEDPAFNKALLSTPNISGRTGAKIQSEFSFEKFFGALKEISQISSEAFTKKDMKEIERLATLNGINEANAASGVSSIYDSQAGKGKHVDFKKLAKIFQEETNYTYLANIRQGRKSNVSGNSDLAKKINIMENNAPKDYLTILQNGSKPASSDLIIINSISENYHLSNGVINALIDYTLATNNNILSKFYIEKIAASLAREGVTNAVDAMNYLNKVAGGKKKVVSEEETIVEEKSAKKDKEESDNNDSLDWNSLIDQIDEGGSDGKA